MSSSPKRPHSLCVPPSLVFNAHGVPLLAVKQNVKLDIHLLLVPKVRISGTLTPIPWMYQRHGT